MTATSVPPFFGVALAAAEAAGEPAGAATGPAQPAATRVIAARAAAARTQELIMRSSSPAL